MTEKDRIAELETALNYANLKLSAAFEALNAATKEHEDAYEALWLRSRQAMDEREAFWRKALGWEDDEFAKVPPATTIKDQLIEAHGKINRQRRELTRLYREVADLRSGLL